MELTTTNIEETIEEGMKNKKTAKEIAEEIVTKINDEWYYSRKDTCEYIITPSFVESQEPKT